MIAAIFATVATAEDKFAERKWELQSGKTFEGALASITRDSVTVYIKTPVALEAVPFNDLVIADQKFCEKVHKTYRKSVEYREPKDLTKYDGNGFAKLQLVLTELGKVINDRVENETLREHLAKCDSAKASAERSIVGLEVKFPLVCRTVKVVDRNGNKQLVDVRKESLYADFEAHVEPSAAWMLEAEALKINPGDVWWITAKIANPEKSTGSAVVFTATDFVGKHPKMPAKQGRFIDDSEQNASNRHDSVSIRLAVLTIRKADANEAAALVKKFPK